MMPMKNINKHAMLCALAFFPLTLCAGNGLDEESLSIAKKSYQNDAEYYSISYHILYLKTLGEGDMKDAVELFLLKRYFSYWYLSKKNRIPDNPRIERAIADAIKNKTIDPKLFPINPDTGSFGPKDNQFIPGPYYMWVMEAADQKAIWKSFATHIAELVDVKRK